MAAQYQNIDLTNIFDSADESNQKIQNALANSSSVSSLDLSRRSCNTLADKIGTFRNLTRLSIKGCEFSKLPVGVTDLRMLELLDFTENQKLTTLDSSICRLQALKTLRVVACGLTKLPECWDGMKSLILLDISANLELTTLPSSICKLQALKILIAIACGLTELPDCCDGMKSLEKLDISNNNFTAYPEVTLHWKNLKTLDISNDSMFTRKKLDTLDNYENSSSNATVGSESPPTIDLSQYLPIEICRRNIISELPFGVVNTSLTDLKLYGNPMVLPPVEVCDQGMESIRLYFRDINLGKEALCTDTINMLGDSEAGKTSIALSLRIGHLVTAGADDRTRVVDQSLANVGSRIVNVNDFGGHEIYQTVIPIFLPSNGLCIIACDISKNIDEQKEQVKKWLMTVYAKSTEIRVIVVGTHSDKLVPKRLRQVKHDIKEYIQGICSSVEQERKDHSRELSSQNPSEGVRDCLNQSNADIAADISFITISCLKPDDRDLEELESLVGKKLKPQEQYPPDWCRIMENITKHESRDGLPYLDWEEVRELCKSQLKKPDPDDATLKVILRSLVSKSQIIWLESSPSLKGFVFHQPQLIISQLKLFLHHDNPGELRKRMGKQFYDNHLLDYKCGFLDEVSFAAMIRDGKLMQVVRDFMVQFRMISRMYEGRWILTNRLEDKAPSLLDDWLSKSVEDPPVCVQLTFPGDCIPLGFLSTALASLLTTICSIKDDALFWKSGIVVELSDIRTVVMLDGSALNLLAFSELAKKNVWKTLCPLLYQIIEYVAESWKGLQPKCTLICPESTCSESLQQSNHKHGRSIVWNTITEIILSPAESTFRCRHCRFQIPGIYVYPNQQGRYSADELEYMGKYLKDYEQRRNGMRQGSKAAAPSSSADQRLAAKQKRPICADGQSSCSATAPYSGTDQIPTTKQRKVDEVDGQSSVTSNQDLSSAITRKMDVIVNKLSEKRVVQIARILIAETLLTTSELEAIKGKSTATEAAGDLVDFVLKSGERAAEAFLAALRDKNVAAGELADLIEKERFR